MLCSPSPRLYKQILSCIVVFVLRLDIAGAPALICMWTLISALSSRLHHYPWAAVQLLAV